MTNSELIALAETIYHDRRSTRRRLEQLCATLVKLVKNPKDAATVIRANQLAGRLNSGCRVVREDVALPETAEDLLKLRVLLLMLIV